jgi:hypothetical protein
MREGHVIQAGKPVIVQAIRGVCVVRGVWNISLMSVSQIGSMVCQRARSINNFSQQQRSSFTPKRQLSSV